jgi:ketosteroid isomerase-like protein
MNQEATRGVVHAFCNALAEQTTEMIAPFLADDVDFTAFGPVDLFPFFGQRYGKDAMIAALTDMFGRIRLKTWRRERTLCDGEHFAALLQVSVEDTKSGRVLSFRLAQFAEVRDGKLASLHVLFDSLDLAEQAIGRPLDLSAVA